MWKVISIPALLGDGTETFDLNYFLSGEELPDTCAEPDEPRRIKIVWFYIRRNKHVQY